MSEAAATHVPSAVREAHPEIPWRASRPKSFPHPYRSPLRQEVLKPLITEIKSVQTIHRVT